MSGGEISYVAKVTSVVPSDGVDGWITFSLESSKEDEERAWKEEKLPVPGNKVVLWDIVMKNDGWRANKARFYRPSDKQD
jgi:hypothetical protein